MIRIISIVALLFAASCTPKVHLSSNQNDFLFQKINNICDSLITNPEFKSISLGVIVDDKIYKIHKGLLRNGKSPNDRTTYEIASLTKTFTGTLLANAIFENKVKLDDDIRKFLPEKYPNLEFAAQPITFRHLVTHQSGLPNMFPNKMEIFNNANWDKLPFEINELQKDYTKSKFFSELLVVKLDTLPGTKLMYSNVGAVLLGYILENVYQNTFDELVKDKILNPLKMFSTETRISKAKKKHLAVGQNASQIEMPFRVEKDMNAEGGMISNVGDMIKYMGYHLNKSDAIVSIAHQQLWNGKFGDFEAGLFWQIYKDGDKPDKIFQNGGAYGTSSWITLIPERNIGVFIITNVAGQNVHQKLNQAVEKIIAEIK